jgi:HlyD family secretion protein
MLIAIPLLAAVFVWAMVPRPIPVQTGVVSRGPLTATVSADGKTHIRDVYQVSAPIDGMLERITVQAGDQVTASSTVARIAPVAARSLDARSRAEAQAAVAVARAALERAAAADSEAAIAAVHADSQFATASLLAKTSSVSRQSALHAGHEAEMRHQALDAAHAAVRQARAELARASAVLATAGGTSGGADVPVKAPVPGYVLRVLRQSAGPVAAGTPLLDLGDLNAIQIEADFLSVDAAAVGLGASATVSGWGGPAIQARVSRIEPAAFTKVSALGLEEQRVHVTLDLAGTRPPNLGDDYHVDVAIAVWTAQDTIRVPSTALFREGGRWAVYAVRGGRAHAVLVQTGASDDSLTAIDRGLAPGEQVIVQPSDAVHDGARVERLGT